MAHRQSRPHFQVAASGRVHPRLAGPAVPPLLRQDGSQSGSTPYPVPEAAGSSHILHTAEGLRYVDLEVCRHFHVDGVPPIPTRDLQAIFDEPELAIVLEDREAWERTLHGFILGSAVGLGIWTLIIGLLVTVL